MSRLSLLPLAVLSLLSFSAPVLAQAPQEDATHAGELSARILEQVVSQAARTPPVVNAPPDVQESPTPVADVVLAEVIHLRMKAFTTRSWGLLACGLVLGAVWVVRHFLSPRVPWLRSDAADIGLSMAAEVSHSLVTALQTGQPVTLTLVLSALLTAAGASGLFSWGKKVTKSVKARQARSS